jgi:GTP-binding protein Era
VSASTQAARSGLVALIGRPNVGKSTLLNALVGQKISIVSAKPHTTRQRILGVLNRGPDQAVFIDTPGHARRSERALHRLMARAFHQAVDECDLAVLVIEAKRVKREDVQLIEMVIERTANAQPGGRSRAILVLNKIDELKARTDLLPRLQSLQHYPFLEFVPLSARTGKNLDALVAAIFAHLPPGEPLFPRDYATDRTLEFRAAEVIREKLLEALHEEVPYGLTVEIEHMQRGDDGRWLVHALIWLDRESHKPIVIGKEGALLKRIGQAARLELNELLGSRVHLELWAKVREHWSDNERELQRLGFD